MGNRKTTCSSHSFRFVPQSDYVTNNNIEGWPRSDIVSNSLFTTTNTTIGTTTTTTILKTFSLARAAEEHPRRERGRQRKRRVAGAISRECRHACRIVREGRSRQTHPGGLGDENKLASGASVVAVFRSLPLRGAEERSRLVMATPATPEEAVNESN